MFVPSLVLSMALVLSSPVAPASNGGVAFAATTTKPTPPPPPPPPPPNCWCQPMPGKSW